METWHFLILLVIVNSAIWVYFAASRARDEFHIGIGPDGTPPHTWAAWVFLLWPVMLPKFIDARQKAGLAERREGPPPRFTTGSYTSFATVVGILGLLIFALLLIQGMFKLATIGLVIAAAGLFGGRHSTMTGETTSVDIGDVGFEQVGFQAPLAGEEADDEEMPEDMVAYFSNLGRGTAQKDPADPLAVTAPPPVAPPDSAAEASNPRPSASAEPAPTSSADETPALGVPYTPPAFGVVYTPPPLDGAESKAAPAPMAPKPETPSTPLEPETPLEAGPVASSLPEASSLPLDEIVARAEAALPSNRRATAPALAPKYQPLIPPAPGDVPAATAPSAEPDATDTSGTYGAAKPEPRSIPWAGIFAALIIIGAASVAAWSHYQNQGSSASSEPAEAVASEDDEPARSAGGAGDADRADRADDTTSADDVAVTQFESDESTEVDYALIEPWLNDYTEYMTPLGAALDVVDYQGLSLGNCKALGQHLATARDEMIPAPDRTINRMVSEALAVFDTGLKKCHEADEEEWAKFFIKGKVLTHQTQELMNDRYQYHGVVELEHEPMNDDERPTISISGRYLAEHTGNVKPTRSGRENGG